MNDTLYFIIAAFALASILCTITSLTIYTWRNTGLQRRVRIAKMNIKIIARQIRNDIYVANH